MSDDERRRKALDEAAEARDAGHDGVGAAAKAIEGLSDEELALNVTDSDSVDDSDEVAADLRALEDGEDVDDEDYESDTRTDDEGAEDVDGEADEDAGDEDADEPARLELDDADMDALVTVKIDGEDVDVPLREALAGHMRQRAFTKKTQELAEIRKDATAKRQEYAEGLNIVSQVLGEHLTPEQDAQLADAAMRLVEDHKAHVAEERRALAEREAQALNDAMGWVEAPESEVSEAKAQLRDYAISQGFQHSELDQAYDHRLILLLDKARRYDEIKEKGGAARKRARKGITLTPGVKHPGESKSGKRKAKAAKKKLERTGSLRDAAAALDAAGLV